MKNLSLIVSLMLFATSVSSQNLTFEETVIYINNKISLYATVDPFGKTKAKSIKVSKTGTVSVFYSDSTKRSFNLFDLATCPSESCVDGVEYEGNQIRFYVQGESFYDIFFSTKVEAYRVFNAIKHIKSKCTRAKDPFD